MIYLSAIAHRLIAKSSTPAADVRETAVQLADRVTRYLAILQAGPVIPGSLSPGITGLQVEVTASGYLQFEFPDRAIAAWLDFLIRVDLSGISAAGRHGGQGTERSPDWVFQLQHAHARCCSLLRLAQAEGMIRLSQSTTHSPNWQIIQPDPVPWLTPDHQVRTHHPAERAMIGHLLTGLDALAQRSPLPLKRLQRLTTELAQAFQTMHRDVQIWGELRSQPPQRLQAHLGLLLASQRLFYTLLEHELGIEAPSEL